MADDHRPCRSWIHTRGTRQPDGAIVFAAFGGGDNFAWDGERAVSPDDPKHSTAQWILDHEADLRPYMSYDEFEDLHRALQQAATVGAALAPAYLRSLGAPTITRHDVAATAAGSLTALLEQHACRFRLDFPAGQDNWSIHLRTCFFWGRIRILFENAESALAESTFKVQRARLFEQRTLAVLPFHLASFEPDVARVVTLLGLRRRKHGPPGKNK